MEYYPLGEKSKAKKEISLIGEATDINESELKEGLINNRSDITTRALILSQSVRRKYPTQEKAIEEAAKGKSHLVFWPSIGLI